MAMKIGVGILAVALVATLGDYSWYTLHVRHSITTGIIHGAVLLTAVGAVLGRDCGPRDARRSLERNRVLSCDEYPLGRPPPTGKNYLLQFAAWVVAWAPGLLALTLGSPRAGRRV